MPKKLSSETIDFNPEFRRALELMEDSDRHVFITGRAGTGKSTLLSYFRGNTKKKAVFLAPTGVAAVNVGGQTIHSFFGFRPDITPGAIRTKIRGDRKDLYKKLTAIVIDEVSMMRADLLDCVDQFLRLNGPDKKEPFGGIQMIFIGDLYQLPPVVTGRDKEIFYTQYTSPYFFSAKVFDNLDLEFIELERIYRQRDGEFIRLLNAIRNRTVTDDDLEIINQRVNPDFEVSPREYRIGLTSTNELADRINEERLARLRGKLWTADGIVNGSFGEEYFPTAQKLKLKKGAQIMLLNNDMYGRWINGTIGRVKGFGQDAEGEDVIRAVLDTGEEVEIAPFTWEIYRFHLKDGELVSDIVGSFTHYPVRLAFAVTIHKSQGKTFKKVLIDVGKGTFAHGQVYVALSRCTTLEGIVLITRIKNSHIRMDWHVVNYLTRIQYRLAEKALSREEKLALIEAAIREKHRLEIVYLKAKDEKSRREIRPYFVGNMIYRGRSFPGMKAVCLLRGEERVFNIDRILKITEL
jgi:ATP-dependent exoDNAse (exonuclease V) alpha subunit